MSFVLWCSTSFWDLLLAIFCKLYFIFKKMDRRCFMCEISLFNMREMFKRSFPKPTAIPRQLWTWKIKNTMKQKQPRWHVMKLETQGIKKVMGLGANRKTRI
jgi:hypothetical protein